MKEHPIDRLMRPLRPLFIAALWLSVPIILFVLGQGLLAIRDTFGLWGMAICSLGSMVSVFGIASLLDSRRQEPPEQ